ncbi:MAG: hypothetical protein ACRC0A_00435 [Chitinophagaceae bacterium]
MAHQEERFVPKGAMAFFVALMAVAAVLWFWIYYIAQSRTM